MLDVEFKGNSSPRFRKELSKAFNSLPTYAVSLIAAKGYRIIAGQKMSDLYPGFTKVDDSIRGYCAPTIKTIFVADKSGWGPTNSWGVLFHEVGHAIDVDVMGTGDYPDGYASIKGAFYNAFLRDTRDLENTGFLSFYDVYREYDTKLECIRDYFTKAVLNPQEIYAELWAQINGRYGSMPDGLLSLMPSCATVVMEHHKKTLPQYALNILCP